MEAYTGFASVYDAFMKNVPYEEWSRYLIGLLQEFGVKKGLIAELGCGTGSMTRLLAQAGYDMIGIDLSEEMLEIARAYELERQTENIETEKACELEYQTENTEAERACELEHQAENTEAEKACELEHQTENTETEKACELEYQTENMETERACELEHQTENTETERAYELEHQIENTEAEKACELEYQTENMEAESEPENVPPGIMYLNQDMREFELYGTVAAIVSICDSMNYILSAKELKQVFKLVNNYLDTGGLFIFDMNTIHKYRDLIGDATIAENQENCSFIWENYYEEESALNQYDITIFKELNKKGRNGDSLFERITETHIQRAYAIEEIIKLLREAGLEFIAAYEVLTRQPATEQAERVYFIAREGHQEGKYYLPLDTL